MYLCMIVCVALFMYVSTCACVASVSLAPSGFFFKVPRRWGLLKAVFPRSTLSAAGPGGAPLKCTGFSGGGRRSLALRGFLWSPRNVGAFLRILAFREDGKVV